MNSTWSILRHTAPAVAFALRWKIVCEGVANIPADGPGVLVFNHYSTLDSVMAAWAPVRSLGREVRFLAKAELSTVPLLGSITRNLKVIPVSRGDSASRDEAFNEALRALGKGDLLAIAPEQMRSPSLEILPFRAGAARLAQATGAPLVPCVGWGSQRLLRSDTRLPRLIGADITVSYLPPTHVSTTQDPAEAVAAVRAQMVSELERIQSVNRRDEQKGSPWTPRRLGGGAPSEEEGLALHREKERGWAEGGAAQ